MKTISGIALLAGLATAHSGVWKINIDGIEYPGRDARIDDELGAKRIEWHRTVTKKNHNAVNAWGPVTDVLNEGITCGRNVTPPELHAVARAGAKVFVQWSGMIKQHNGPVLTYLGALPSANTRPQDISFFKIAEGGYDKVKQLWKNEEVIAQGHIDMFQLPSDIKPGMYVLRTELAALHSNNITVPGIGGGPQMFTHCFNIDIKGDGIVQPPGVKFPGGYKPDEPGIKFNLYANGDAAWENYIIPGPPKYQGKYENPTGLQPLLSDKDRGLFPPEFQFKYETYKKTLDTFSSQTAKMVNVQVPGGKGGKAAAGGETAKILNEFYSKHHEEQKEIDRLFDVLRQEAVKIGLVKA